MSRLGLVVAFVPAAARQLLGATIVGSVVLPGGRMLIALRFLLAVNCGQAKDGGSSAVARPSAWAEEGVWFVGRGVWGSMAEVVAGRAVSRFRVS